MFFFSASSDAERQLRNQLRLLFPSRVVANCLVIKLRWKKKWKVEKKFDRRRAFPYSSLFCLFRTACMENVRSPLMWWVERTVGPTDCMHVDWTMTRDVCELCENKQHKQKMWRRIIKVLRYRNEKKRKTFKKLIKNRWKLRSKNI